MAIAIATRCDGCVAFHAEAALKQGASRAEVLETVGMAIYMGAGPSVMYAAQALAAFGQFSAAAAPRPPGMARGPAHGAPGLGSRPAR